MKKHLLLLFMFLFIGTVFAQDNVGFKIQYIKSSEMNEFEKFNAYILFDRGYIYFKKSNAIISSKIQILKQEESVGNTIKYVLKDLDSDLIFGGLYEEKEGYSIFTFYFLDETWYKYLMINTN